MTRINPRYAPPPPDVKPAVRQEPIRTPQIANPLERAEQLTTNHERQRASGKFPALIPSGGNNAAFEGVPTMSLRDVQRGVPPVMEKPDLSQAKVFGRPVETGSSHDLFWHYFGGKASPTNNTEARAMMADMQEKFAPFGFKVEPIEHERMDKVRITGPDGKVEEVDFIFAMGGEPGQQRLQWLAGNAGPGPAAGGSVDANFVSGILGGFEPTNDGIVKALAELKKRKGYENVRILEHPQRLDKLDFGNGQIVDVIIGAGGRNPRWGWLPE